ncbi:MAG: hypothetical protein ABID61_05170 [Candidatus Micrarchaeota archaeon]
MRKYVFLLVLMLTISFAAIWESGDGGKEFAKNTIEKMCIEPDTAAVYSCNGNVIRVVSSTSGAGSTFYKPDGRIVNCPEVSAPAMGAECLQMMMPNYCPQQEQCGESNATIVFPGNDLETPVVEPEPVEPEENNTVVQPPVEPPVTPPPTPPVIEPPPVEPTVNPTPIIKTGTENPMNFVLPIVLLLGVAAIIILFMLFRNSIHHDV